MPALNVTMTRRLGFACVTLLLTACAVTPPEHPPPAVPLPAQFAAAPAAASPASERWWEAFGDGQLDAFVQDALDRNPGIGQAIARARIAEAQARVAGADRLPQAGVGLNSSRQRQSLPAFPGVEEGGHTTINNHALSLDVSWELDLWGRLGAMTTAARADALAAQAQLRGVRQAIAAETARLYLTIVESRAQVDLSTRTVEALTEMARQIDNRVQAGIAAPSDGMLANANLESARAGLEQRREVLARALRQLEILMGDYPSATLATADTLPPVPALPATGVPAGLLARRPDVLAADWMLQAAGYRLGAAQRSFLPSLTLSASGGAAAGSLADLFQSGNVVWSIAGSLLQPIFQGGRLRAQVDVTGAQRDEALHSYAETALTALAEVETALAVDAYLARREDALALSASAAEEAVRVSVNRYLQGIDPFLNVLESQQRALDGRSAHIAARQARLDNRIDLHLALGGGFADPLPSDSSPSTVSLP